MLVADEEKGLINNCHISSQEALNLIQPLHALIDEELMHGSFKPSSKDETECTKQCHCGIYSDFAKNKLMKNNLFQKAQATTKKQLTECANQTAHWFCQSELLKTLKIEASKY